MAATIVAAILALPAALVAAPALTPTPEAHATPETKPPSSHDGPKVVRFALVIGNNQPESA
jgi:hypothetical protein